MVAKKRREQGEWEPKSSRPVPHAESVEKRTKASEDVTARLYFHGPGDAFWESMSTFGTRNLTMRVVTIFPGHKRGSYIEWQQ